MIEFSPRVDSNAELWGALAKRKEDELLGISSCVKVCCRLSHDLTPKHCVEVKFIDTKIHQDGVLTNATIATPHGIPELHRR